MGLHWDSFNQWAWHKKIIIIVAWLVLLSCMLYLVFVRTAWQAKHQLHLKINSLHLQITQQNSQLAKLVQQIEATKSSDATHFENFYIASSQLYQWIDFLVHLAQQNHLTLLSSHVLQPIQANFYQEFPFQLRLTGNYQQFSNFLAQLTELTPLFLTGNLSLNPKDQRVSQQLSIELTLRAFVLNNSNHQSAEFIVPDLKKTDLVLTHDPFSPKLIQSNFALYNLKMLGSIINGTKRWGLLQNGHEIIHVSAGQQLDTHTKVNAVTAQAITIEQTYSHTTPQIWQLLLSEKTS